MHDHEHHDDHTESTPEEDVEIARMALDQGDARHAAFHLAWAIAADPSRRDWLALLERCASGSADPLAVVPLEEGETSFAVVAARAYLTARIGPGRVGEAICLLLEVFLAKPDAPYLAAWAVGWLKSPEAVASIELAALNSRLAGVVARHPGDAFTADDHSALAGLLPFAEALRSARDQLAPPARRRRFGLFGGPKPNADAQARGLFFFLVSAIFRKLGRLDEAFELASEGHVRYPSPPTAIGLAMVLRLRGDVDGAVDAYLDAARRDPSDTSALADAAMTLWRAGRAQDAERFYGQALVRMPDDPKSLPNYLYLRYLSSNYDRAWLEKLRDFVRAHPDHAEARGNLRRLTPFFGFLPSPGDAQVSIFRQLEEAKAKDPAKGYPKITRFSSSTLEAPSGRVAFGLMTGTLGAGPLVECEVGEIAEPDPREPTRAVPYRLWRYEGTTPIAVVPPPAPEVAAAVAEIAARRYDLNEWAETAGALGERLGPDHVDDLLGAMIHPTAPREGHDAWDWIVRLQVASALALARIDRGWQGSLRRKVLLALVDGPLDWSVSAAAVALAVVSRDGGEIVAEVREALHRRLVAMPKPGDVCFALPAIYCLFETPDLDDDYYQALRNLCRSLES